MDINEQEINKIEKRAYQFEKNYSVCPQAVLAAFKEEFDFVSDDLFKAGTGLAGGIGLTGNTCGALIGGAMILSVISGRDYEDLEDKERKRYDALGMAKELIEKFKGEYGTTNCFEIQKMLMGRSFNLWNNKDKEEFVKAGGHDDKCTFVCGKAARWCAEILKKNNV